jgi:signal transduction histidine kinase
VLRSAQTRVELDTPEHLHATLVPGQFSQIVSNLIVNALTHAFQEQPEDRPRLIRVRLHSQGERLQLHFSDNGRGVPPEVRARMFEPYFTTRRGSGGSGLGLYIVHKLCEQMGGQIVVDEAHAPGLGFRVDLPLRD